jgi:hypothetical protein
MSKQHKYLFDRSDWKSVFVNVVAGIILLYVPANFIPSVWSFTKRAVKFIYAILTTTYNIPLWILVPLILCMLFILLLILVRFFPGQKIFDYHDFTTSIYDNIKWEWLWGDTGVVQSLTPRCQKCDCILISKQSIPSKSFGFSCEKCGQEVARSEGGYSNYNSYLRRIEFLIDQDIRQKERIWRESMEQKQG